MGFDRVSFNVFGRCALLFGTLCVLAWLVVTTTSYATMLICVCAVGFQFFTLLRFMDDGNRRIAQFLQAAAGGDGALDLLGSNATSSLGMLNTTINQLTERARTARSEQEEQKQFLNALLSHIPVALVLLDESSSVKLLNPAARRMFGGDVHKLSDLGRFGDAFLNELTKLHSGTSNLLTIHGNGGPLHVKTSVSLISTQGRLYRLISLQNIQSELSAQEFGAWQQLIRVLSHEMMNSLTPVCSLSATALDIIEETRSQQVLDQSMLRSFSTIEEAIAAVNRRSEGLLQFVENYRRLTHELLPKSRDVFVGDIFSNLHRLFAADLEAANVAMSNSIDPNTLEIWADPELLTQALINLIRNALEALKRSPNGRIHLSASHDRLGRVMISVIDNGPGIDTCLAEKIFVPFFTTKQGGSGVGLALAKQIAAIHSGSIDLSTAEGGGAVFTLRMPIYSRVDTPKPAASASLPQQ